MSDLNPTPAPTPEGPTEQTLSIWRDMWLKPRAVLRQELARPPHWSNWLPAMLAGIAAMLETFALAQSGNVPPTVPPMAKPGPQELLLMALLLGPLSGLLHVTIMGFLLRLMGRWFGGNAVVPAAMRRGISLALVPMAFSLLLIVFELIWKSAGGDNASGDWLITFSTGLRTALNIWFLLLLVMTVSEVQALSVRRATLTVASTMLLLLGVFLALRGPL